MSVHFINPINAPNMKHNTQFYTYAYRKGFPQLFQAFGSNSYQELVTLTNSGGDSSETNDWAAPQNEGHKCFLATHHTMQHY